jgi:hypothetical protein
MYAAALYPIVLTRAPEVSWAYGLRSQYEINMTGLQVAVLAGVFPRYCRDMRTRNAPWRRRSLPRLQQRS